MSAEAEARDLAIALEEGAHRLRVAMLGDAEFMAGLELGLEDERAGRMISFAEFKRELGLD